MAKPVATAVPACAIAGFDELATELGAEGVGGGAGATKTGTGGEGAAVGGTGAEAEVVVVTNSYAMMNQMNKNVIIVIIFEIVF
jgi:hypothetical protein